MHVALNTILLSYDLNEQRCENDKLQDIPFVFLFVCGDACGVCMRFGFGINSRNFSQINMYMYYKLIYLVGSDECVYHLSRIVRNRYFLYAKTKTLISFAVTAKQISAFVFATRIVQSLYYLNPKFQASNHLLWLYSLVCVGPGRKPRRPVFSQRGCVRIINQCTARDYDAIYRLQTFP